MPETLLRWLPWLALCGVLAGNAVWLAHDELASGYEVADHLLLVNAAGHQLHRAVESDAPIAALGGWFVRNRREYTRSMFVHMALGPLLIADATPRSVARLALVNGVIALLVLMLATRALGRRLGDEETGAWAGALVVLLPGVWGTSRGFAVDLPLAAGVVAVAALMAREGAWRGRGALWLGLAAGVVALVKGQCLFWLPWIALPTLLASEETRRARALALFGAGFALGSAPLWAGEPLELLRIAAHHVGSTGDPTDARAEGVPGALWYLQGCWTWLGPPTCVALLVGWALHARRLARGDGGSLRWLLPVWVVGGLLWHGAMSVRWMRFIVPVFAPLLVGGLLGLRALPTKWRRGLLAALVASLAALCCVASTTYATGWVDVRICRPPRRANWHAVADRLASQVHPPPASVGIDAPRWGADDYRMLELYLRRHWPDAWVFYNHGYATGSVPREEYARERADGLDVEVFVDKPAPRTPGTRRLRLGSLHHEGFGFRAERQVEALVRER